MTIRRNDKKECGCNLFFALLYPNVIHLYLPKRRRFNKKEE